MINSISPASFVKIISTEFSTQANNQATQLNRRKRLKQLRKCQELDAKNPRLNDFVYNIIHMYGENEMNKWQYAYGRSYQLTMKQSKVKQSNEMSSHLSTLSSMQDLYAPAFRNVKEKGMK